MQEGHSELKTDTHIACHKREGQSAAQLVETGALAEQEKTQLKFLFSVARVEAKYKQIDWLLVWNNVRKIGVCITYRLAEFKPFC
jgi:hypothetical protein